MNVHAYGASNVNRFGLETKRDIIVRAIGAELNSGAAALGYQDCLFTNGREGVVAQCSISELREQHYVIDVVGSAFSASGLEDCVITIARASDGAILKQQSLLSCLRTGNRACFTAIFNNTNPNDGIKVSIRTSAAAQFRIDAIELSNADYLFDFAIVNKSYIKDLPWTIVLYRSWTRFSQVDCPFYIVVPNQDLPAFVEAFRSELDAGRIARMPNLVTEEWVFDIGAITIPEHFSGWQTQQIVKLGFSKTRIARQYLTVDSTMLFTKPFDFRRLLKSGIIYTAANRTNRHDFFEYFRRVDEKGWLNGNLVNISESFNAICEFMGNTTNDTNAYVSCTGMFNSELAIELESYARGRGANGFVGLILIAPYEFAWFGEFVFSQRREQFIPHDPHLMTLGHSEEHARTLSEGTMRSEDYHMGIMLQPPASDLCDPARIFSMVAEGQIR